MEQSNTIFSAKSARASPRKKEKEIPLRVTNLPTLPAIQKLMPNDNKNQLVQKKQKKSNKFDGLKEEVEREFLKNRLMQINQDRQKFEKLVERAQTILLKIRAVFPFDFFPDEISIEPNQVNVTRKYFFWSENLQSIPIKNINEVFVQTSIFFATIKIVDLSFVENTIDVGYLKKHEANCARRIIQGLVIACKEGIDLVNLDNEELRMKAEALGEAKEIENFTSLGK